jgi:MtN3 and saliva related transmembrane protein
MDLVTAIFGYLAAAFTTISFVPQAVKIIRSRHTKDISLGMYAILNAGVICWLFYGYLNDNLPILVANMITILFTSTILIMKIRYK